MTRGAWISDCGKYRYTLTRVWEERLPHVAFVMLNPSTADAEQDDPTIRKCIGFAKRWGYGGLTVLNLYAYRSTDPRQLKKVWDPVGPENHFLTDVLQGCARVVLAWGANGGERGQRMMKAIAGVHPQVYAFKFTKDGHPEHPLYQPYDRELVRITQ